MRNNPAMVHSLGRDGYVRRWEVIVSDEGLRNLRYLVSEEDDRVDWEEVRAELQRSVPCPSCELGMLTAYPVVGLEIPVGW